MTLLPRRLREQEGRFSLVDGIPFKVPVQSWKTPALMAAFPIDADKAAKLFPGTELHPYRLFGRGLLVITVVDYRDTSIGKYIEFSIAIACTHGRRPVGTILPMLFQNHYGLGQYVYDLPVSTEISVKGGKGIWGMPKHRGSLDFIERETEVSSQYDIDGRLAMRIDVEKPRGLRIPLFSVPGANYCAFRGMLYKSNVFFTGRIAPSLGGKGKARLTLGDQPGMRTLKELDIGADPVFTAFFPETHGVLDDHFECWFLSFDQLPSNRPEGMESVVNLGLGQVWPEGPRRSDAAETKR